MLIFGGASDLLYRFSASVGTFSRTSPASYIDTSGVLQTALAGVMRTLHYTGTLIEGASTNLCLQSENFGTTWSGVSAPTRINALNTASGVSLDLIGDTDGSADSYFKQSITFTGDGTKGISIFMKAGTSAASRVILMDTTASVGRLTANVTWTAGVPSVSTTGGTYLGKEALVGGVYRLLFSASGVVAANVNQVRVAPTLPLSSLTGDVYAGGVQCENRAIPSSYIKTTTATVARTADSFSVPYTATPQTSTIYLKVQELGPSLGTMLFIGTAASVAPYIDISNNGASSTVGRHNPSSAVTSVANPDATMLDSVEYRMTIFSDGSVLIGRSINGGTETLGVQSASSAFAATWGASPVLMIGSDTAGNQTNMAISAVKVSKGTKTMTEMRAM